MKILTFLSLLLVLDTPRGLASFVFVAFVFRGGFRGVWVEVHILVRGCSRGSGRAGAAPVPRQVLGPAGSSGGRPEPNDTDQRGHVKSPLC